MTSAAQSVFEVAAAVDGYDPALMMDGSPDLYDERLMYNGGAGAGRYVHPSVAARLVLIRDVESLFFV